MHVLTLTGGRHLSLDNQRLYADALGGGAVAVMRGGVVSRILQVLRFDATVLLSQRSSASIQRESEMNETYGKSQLVKQSPDAVKYLHSGS
jgi:hypothetical protein